MCFCIIRFVFRLFVQFWYWMQPLSNAEHLEQCYFMMVNNKNSTFWHIFFFICQMTFWRTKQRKNCTKYKDPQIKWKKSPWLGHSHPIMLLFMPFLLIEMADISFLVILALCWLNPLNLCSSTHRNKPLSVKKSKQIECENIFQKQREGRKWKFEPQPSDA